jgi:hypothetical protein
MIFLDRDIDEVLASQTKMRLRTGNQVQQNNSQMYNAMKSHRDTTLNLLKRFSNIRLLIVPYHGLIAEPERWIDQIAEFLSNRFSLNKTEMARTIDPSLYRNRLSNFTSETEQLTTSRP